MAGVTFDTGVLIAADRNDARAWAWKKEAVERRGIVPVIPSVVLVQAWRGPRNANMARFLRGCFVESLERDLSLEAGELCRKASASDVTDTVVMASAGRRGDTIVTSDPEDLRALSAFFPGVKIAEL